MKELIKITNDAVNARELYNFLGMKQHFRDWIRLSIRDYNFIEGVDFRYFFSETKTEGRPPKEYALSMNMAKELAMVSKTKKGKEVRNYFIQCEERAKKAHVSYQAIRLAGKELRKTVTDKIKESGEDKRMHGHGYSNYTILAYKLAGVEYIKTEKYRNSLSADSLKRVSTIENLIKGLLDAGKGYAEIRNTLGNVFTKNEIENKE